MEKKQDTSQTQQQSSILTQQESEVSLKYCKIIKVFKQQNQVVMQELCKQSSQRNGQKRRGGISLEVGQINEAIMKDQEAKLLKDWGDKM